MFVMCSTWHVVCVLFAFFIFDIENPNPILPVNFMQQSKNKNETNLCLNVNGPLLYAQSVFILIPKYVRIKSSKELKSLVYA